MDTLLFEYKELTGLIPEEGHGRAPVHVPSLDYGGTGGGYVSDAFWTNTALPVLRNRSTP